MGQFSSTLTSRGVALQAKVQAGAQLQFTRIAMGDGDLSGTDPVTLESLKNQKKSLSISKLASSNGRAVVGAVYNNSDITTGFYFRELGAFAMDPDVGEVLYCYGNSGASADYIPAGGSGTIVENAVNINTFVGNAASVTADIDESLIFVTQEEFEEVTDAMDVMNGDGWVTTARLGGKVVTETKVADGAASDTVIGNRTISDASSPASNTGSITNLFSWLAYMIKSITGKSTWRTAPAITLEDAKTHIDKTTSVHGSTSAATANTIVQRDGDGQINVGTTTANSHAATKIYVDNLNKHVAVSDNVLFTKVGTTEVSGSISIHLKNPGRYRLKGEFRASSGTASFELRFGLVSAGNLTADYFSGTSTTSTTFVSFSIDLPYLPGHCRLLIYNLSGSTCFFRNVTICGDEVVGDQDAFS